MFQVSERVLVFPRYGRSVGMTPRYGHATEPMAVAPVLLPPKNDSQDARANVLKLYNCISFHCLGHLDYAMCPLVWPPWLPHSEI